MKLGCLIVVIVAHLTLISASLLSNLFSNRIMKPATSINSSPAWPQTGNPHVLVTGGAGYIGSHTIVSLLESGYDVTVVDNLVNSNVESLARVLKLAGCSDTPNRLRFYKADLCDAEALEQVFLTSPPFSSCIHFAGLKAVGESVRLPLLYYRNNLDGTFCLLDCLDRHGCRTLVFSSSATVRVLFSCLASLTKIETRCLSVCFTV